MIKPKEQRIVEAFAVTVNEMIAYLGDTAIFLRLYGARMAQERDLSGRTAQHIAQARKGEYGKIWEDCGDPGIIEG